MSAISARMLATNAAFEAVKNFCFNSRYAERRLEPGICDFTFGNPHEMPLEGIVAAIRERAIPHDKNWFAYKTSEEDPKAFIEGTFYLWSKWIDSDPQRQWNSLADRDVFVLPGSLMNAPDYFRMSLTASDEMVERALPILAK
jgi:hypothetical protein